MALSARPQFGGAFAAGGRGDSIIPPLHRARCSSSRRKAGEQSRQEVYPGEDAAAGGGDPKEHSALPDGDGYGGPGRTGSGRAEEAAPARADCRPDQVLTQLQMRARNNFRGPSRTRFAIENKAAV